MQRLVNLSKLNLNLLISLKALLDERNVTLAAERLNFTQPTMSRNLSHLREYFQDALLVRSGKEFILSSLAQDLNDKLDTVINAIESLFEISFEPSIAEREFIIAAPDYVVHYVLCDVLTFLSQKESQLCFCVKNWDEAAKDQLIAGDVHLAISIDSKFPPNMYHRPVDEDCLVVAFRRDHPLSREKDLGVNDFVAYPHIAVITGGGWMDIVDRPLRELGKRRRIKVKLSSYGAALKIAKQSDLLVVLPQHVARNTLDDDSLLYRPLPFKVPKVQMTLWWHECHQNDPAHKWLREEIFPKIIHHPNQLGISGQKLVALTGMRRAASQLDVPML